MKNINFFQISIIILAGIATARYFDVSWDIIEIILLLTLIILITIFREKIKNTLKKYAENKY